MTETTHLALPFIEGSQAQKHVTHNEALRMLDALVMLAVLDRDLAAPPDSPADGDRYIVAAAGTGAFAGKDGQIASFDDGGWTFYAPGAGWVGYVADEAALLVHDGSDWQVATGAVLQNLARLGIGTTADDTNPFAAKLNNVLWAARTVAEGGDGDLRYKMSKESAGKTLSLLFQDNYSGRAEFGLTGDDDFHVKVSPDGTTWAEAIKVAQASGKVSFPSGTAGLRTMLTAPRTYYVRTDGSDSNDGLSDTSGGAFLTIQKAIDIVFGTLDLGGQAVTIQLGDGSYTAGIDQRSPQTGAGLVTVQGNAAHPENVVVTTTGAPAAVLVTNGAVLAVKDFEVRTVTSGVGLYANTGASLAFGNMRLGACAGHHIRADDGARVTCTGGYAIVGNGASHWNCVGGGILRVQSKTITLSGTPAFTNFAFLQIGALAVVNGNTFSGSATGVRYNIDTNSVAYVAGASSTYLPGNSAGTAASGAQYA